MGNFNQKKDKKIVKKITRRSSVSKTQKGKFTRQMARRIWSDTSFLEKEITKYQNIKVIYD